MKRLKWAFILLLTIGMVALLTACNEETNGQVTDENIDIEQLVHEYSTKNFDDISASINSDELIVNYMDGNEQTYDLPEDKFFVSIAPFVDETHPCAIHSLTGCQGEMVAEEFVVEIRDSEGNITIDEKMKTLENGFIDLWLPRDENFQIHIIQGGKEAKAELSTFSGDNTCITTMQLKGHSDE